MKENERPRVLVVAGYDQSAGAGVLADIKTLEAHSVYGSAVCTGFTFQNERVIRRVQWFTEKEIFEQIDCCCETASFEWVKIGIGRSVEMIAAIIGHLREHNPFIRVVLDPVIRASSGKDFWEEGVVAGTDGRMTAMQRGASDRVTATQRDAFERVAAACYLLTPNREEMGWLYPGEDIAERCRMLTRSGGCNLYLKGGHDPEHPGRDHLWRDGEVLTLEPAVDPATVYSKHGSGCVLSSSLAANLSLGYALPVAAALSKRYIEQFLTSNKTLLGWHRPLNDCIS
jgi:hydroxymethylpyrimidine/phosphomethylpyrimidine kinase